MKNRSAVSVVTVLVCLASVCSSQAAAPGSLQAWGFKTYNACDVPSGDDFVAVDGGYQYSVVLKADGSLAAWGTNAYGQCSVPSGNNFVAVAACFESALALKADGTLAGWGRNTAGECNVPSGNNFTAVAGGMYHGLALKAGGSLAAWGENDYGQCNVPSGNSFVAVAAGVEYSLALKADGSLAAWGRNTDGQCNVPSGKDFVAIACGAYHALALKQDGSLAAWGYNGLGQCNVPSGNDFVAVASGAYCSLALKQDGALVAWGDNSHHQCDVPGGIRFLSIASGEYHSLGIVPEPATLSLLALGALVSLKRRRAGREPPCGRKDRLSQRKGAALRSATLSFALGAVAMMGLVACPAAADDAGSLPVGLTLSTPLSRAVIQRNNANQGQIRFAGTYTGGQIDRLEARVTTRSGFGGTSTDWTVADPAPGPGTFSANLTATGGWYDLEIRAVKDGLVVGETTVARVGVGEVFVTAGQSNSCNFGSPRQQPQDDRVCAMSYGGGSVSWQLANDPQPDSSGGGGSNGSPWPAMGDRLAARYGVPIGVVTTGYGGTSVAQWQPGGALYANFRTALTTLGAGGFRAILWHQGETDASGGTTTALYAQRLGNVITQSRTDAGFNVPWGVALASYLPGNTAANMAKVVAGQQQVISTFPGVFLGSQTDNYHNLGLCSDGIHFNDAGLKDHGRQWAAALEASGIILPEPASAGFLLLGLSWLIRRRRRNRACTGHASAGRPATLSLLGVSGVLLLKRGRRPTA